MFNKNKNFSNLKLNYIEGVDTKTLQEMTEKECNKYAKLLNKEYKIVYARGIIPKSILLDYVKEISDTPFTRESESENE